MAKYQLKSPITAVLHQRGEKQSQELPIGAVLEEASRHSCTIDGKIGVYWEGRHYSVSLKDLFTKTTVLGR